MDSPCETVNFLGTRTPQITVQHDLAEKLILLLGFVLLLYMLLMYVVLIVNIRCDDELDICRKFMSSICRELASRGKSWLRSRSMSSNHLARASRYFQQQQAKVLTDSLVPASSNEECLIFSHHCSWMLLGSDECIAKQLWKINRDVVEI